MKQNKILSLLGLAVLNGFLCHKSAAYHHAGPSGKARLVIVSGDASDNTKKDFKNMCEFYHVPMFVYST